MLWLVVFWTGIIATNSNDKNASEYLKVSIIFKRMYSGEIEGILNLFFLRSKRKSRENCIQ